MVALVLFKDVCAGVGEARVWMERHADSKYNNTKRRIIVVLERCNIYDSVSNGHDGLLFEFSGGFLLLGGKTCRDSDGKRPT